MEIYIFWWYSGSEYLLGGLFSEKQAAIEHMERQWAKDELQLYTKSFFVMKALLNEAAIIAPYNVPDAERILPEEVAAWRGGNR